MNTDAVWHVRLYYSQYIHHVSECSVQCAIGTRNREMTVLWLCLQTISFIGFLFGFLSTAVSMHKSPQAPTDFRYRIIKLAVNLQCIHSCLLHCAVLTHTIAHFIVQVVPCIHMYTEALEKKLTLVQQQQASYIDSACHSNCISNPDPRGHAGTWSDWSLSAVLHLYSKHKLINMCLISPWPG